MASDLPETPAGGPTAPGGGPIFILGAMGSGTTLLRLMLDSHERIAVPPETGFMRGYDALRFTPFKYSGRWLKRMGWEPEEIDEIARELYDKLFMRYASMHGKVRWGDKTPLHTWHVDDMARVFPDAVFVCVIRHPLASIASNMSRFGRTEKWAWYHWRRYASELARQATRHPDRMVFIRYEDLVLQPEATLRQLLEWLGEPWSDLVLQHHVVQSSRQRKKRDLSSPAPWDVRQPEGRVRVDDPVDVSRIDKWTRTLTPKQVKAAAKRLRRVGELYGYTMKDASPTGPLSRDGSPLATGADIAARVDASGLDLDAFAKRALHDGFYNPRKVAILSVEDFERFKKMQEPQGSQGAAVDLVRRLPPVPRKALVRTARRVRAARRRSS